MGNPVLHCYKTNFYSLNQNWPLSLLVRVLIINTINFWKNLDKIQTIGPVKCTVTLKVPFINKSSEILEKKIKHLIRNTYYAANPRVVFTSKPLLTPGGKNTVSIFNKSMIIYQYSCWFYRVLNVFFFKLSFLLWFFFCSKYCNDTTIFYEIICCYTVCKACFYFIFAICIYLLVLLIYS